MGQTQSSSSSSSYVSETQADFDGIKYSGKWYEIAKFPLKWEIGCSNAMAEYTYAPVSKMLYVKNSCETKDGNIYSRTGTASFTETSGKLKLLFNDGLPNDGISDYWVLSTDYVSYALVGGPTKEFLWVLSRSPQMSQCLYKRIVNTLSTVFRYDTQRLLLNPNKLTVC